MTNKEMNYQEMNYQEDPGMALNRVTFAEIEPPEDYAACVALRRALGALPKRQRFAVSFHGESSVIGYVDRERLESEGPELLAWAQRALPDLWEDGVGARPGVFIDYSLVEEE